MAFLEATSCFFQFLDGVFLQFSGTNRNPYKARYHMPAQIAKFRRRRTSNEFDESPQPEQD